MVGHVNLQAGGELKALTGRKAYAQLHLDSRHLLHTVDPRLFGSFVEHMGRSTYTGIFESGHPSADAVGFRQDVAGLIRELAPTVVRYPGGNFVSTYNWEDGVGPVNEPPVRLDPAWRATEPNTVGTNEFITWCRAIGAEPMLAFNLGTRGVAEALQYWEYCNNPGGTALSKLRIAHGYRETHDVRLWCLGSEMDGPWQMGHKTAEEYGRLACETARALKQCDPTLELIVAGSCSAGSAGLPRRRAAHGRDHPHHLRHLRLRESTQAREEGHPPRLCDQPPPHPSSLSPIYSSPKDDNGYDISDYLGIDPDYGTDADFHTLAAGLKQRGLKLILDQVLDHTSDEHAWFVESRSSRDNPKRDWYLWVDPRGYDAEGRPIAPNNWKCAFEGSAWEWDEATGQFYLHYFSRKQPDLNWRNPEVRQALYAMLREWIARGADGFRLDVINMIAKAEGYPDVPRPEGNIDPLLPLTEDQPLFANYESSNGAILRPWEAAVFIESATKLPP